SPLSLYFDVTAQSFLIHFDRQKSGIAVTGHLDHNFLKCSLIVRLHKYIICFDLEMYFLIDNNMTTTVVVINKLMHLVKFYNFAVLNLKYHNLLKIYISLKITTF